jgi:hypothetical protein
VRAQIVLHQHDLACMGEVSVGVDFTDVVTGLEEAGLASFAKSWDELIASVTSQIEKAGAEVTPSGAVKPANVGGQAKAPASAAPR